MLMLNLRRFLRKKVFREVAEAQDIIIVSLAEKGVVLHGGAAIWRVYGGKRFSYDIDLYHQDPQEVGRELRRIEELTLEKERTTSSGVLYSRLRRGRIAVEVDVSPFYREVEAVEGRYLMVDGSTLVVLTLTPEDLLREKAEAYLRRRRAKDLYDVYYLLGLVDPEKVASSLRRLTEALETPPSDIGELKELILVGLAPSFSTMRREVLKHAKA